MSGHFNENSLPAIRKNLKGNNFYARTKISFIRTNSQNFLLNYRDAEDVKDLETGQIYDQHHLRVELAFLLLRLICLSKVVEVFKIKIIQNHVINPIINVIVLAMTSWSCK